MRDYVSCRRILNQIIEYPIDIGLHALGIAEPGPELVDQAVDHLLNDAEDALGVLKDNPPPQPNPAATRKGA